MSDKSIFFRVPKTSKEGFLVQHDHLPYFYDRLHYHPELQLKYIMQGSGDLFISDTITDFNAGDIFLVGPNQSHVFKSESEYFEGNSELVSQSISIFFHEGSLGDGFFKIQEMSHISDLIEKSGRGLQFSNEICKSVGSKMMRLLNKSGFNRFQEILLILNELALSKKYKFLASMNSSHPLTDNENQKVSKVINYILSHYDKEIKLEEVANVANYSQSAFCHFFKSRTRKTFIQFLTEVRVSQASKLLRNTDLNVSQICYESGFNNVSNFNRQFKKRMGLSPTDYKQKYNEAFESV